MTIYQHIHSTDTFTWGEEHTVASFHKWIKGLFDHDKGYPVVFDADNKEFCSRQNVTFPNINVQQIDTQDLTGQFIGGKANKATLLFYIYFNHHLAQGGSRRLVRRGRDQISFALKMAGIMNKAGTDFVVEPIYIYDFSKSPPVKTNYALTVASGIQQRFTQDVDILQEEMMVSLTYVEQLYSS